MTSNFISCVHIYSQSESHNVGNSFVFLDIHVTPKGLINLVGAKRAHQQVTRLVSLEKSCYVLSQMLANQFYLQIALNEQIHLVLLGQHRPYT